MTGVQTCALPILMFVLTIKNIIKFVSINFIIIFQLIQFFSEFWILFEEIFHQLLLFCSL